MEEVKYAPDEIPFRLVFLKDLSETHLDNKRAPLLLVGTVTQIVKSNENMCVFFIEDCTMGHIAEFFRNKLSPFLKVNKGDIVEIKAFYSLNKYGEKIIKIFKLRKMTIDEEYLHYLEVLVQEKREADPLFNEHRVIEMANKEATETFIKVVPREEVLRKKIYSYIFYHCLKNWQQYFDLHGYISKSEIIDINEISIIKSKMEDDQKFNVLLDEVCKSLIHSKVLLKYESGFVINLKFFENFETDLFVGIKKYYKDHINFKQIYALFNEMIPDNNDFNIYQEVVYEFLNGMIFKKKLYFIDEKQAVFGYIN